MLRFILAAAIIVSVPTVAYPCINATLLSGNKAAKQIKKADKLLAQGKYKKALRLVDSDRYQFDEPNLTERAEIIEAVASMRLGYQIPTSFNTLRGRSLLKPDDPYLAARAAEAMILRIDYKPSDEWEPKALGKDAARDLLNKAMATMADLDDRDLMPDAYGYATLATLHHRKGDAKARDKALSRCRKMTKRRAICKVKK